MKTLNWISVAKLPKKKVFRVSPSLDEEFKIKPFALNEENESETPVKP